MLRRYWPGLIVLLLVLLFLWWVRPIFHGLVMFFYTSPIVWLPPIVILAIGFAVRRYRRPKLSKRDLELLVGRDDDESTGESVAACPLSCRRRSRGGTCVLRVRARRGLQGSAHESRDLQAHGLRVDRRASRGRRRPPHAAGSRGPDRLQRLQLSDREADRLSQRRRLRKVLPGPHSALPMAPSGSSRRRARGSSP